MIALFLAIDLVGFGRIVLRRCDIFCVTHCGGLGNICNVIVAIGNKRRMALGKFTFLMVNFALSEHFALASRRVFGTNG